MGNPHHTSLATAPAASVNQDRVAVIERSHGLTLVVADGAGGRSGGAEAAQLAVDLVREAEVLEKDFANPLVWCELLRQVDQAICVDPNAGETTAVVVAVSEDTICGSSVGDSGALLIRHAGAPPRHRVPLSPSGRGRGEGHDHSRNAQIDLTQDQHRKPFLGTGVASPVPFGPLPLDGTLIVATDGLLKYASPQTIRQTALAADPSQTAQALVDRVRYSSGALPDDIAVIACCR